jgi:hypothetical protein
LCGEYRLLVSWCACGRCDMAGSDEDRGRSRRPGAEDWRYSVTCRVLGGWTIRRSDDVVCDLHHARGDEERMFLGWASKPRATDHWDDFSWFDLKTGGDGFSRFDLKTSDDGLSQFGLKTGGFKFSGLGIKTDGYDLVVCASKSLRWFLGLSLKTKRATVYRLRHKNDRRMKTTLDTCWDLTVCFAWKQVSLGFFSLDSRLVEARCGWCTWHHRGGRVEVKQKDEWFDGVGCGAMEVGPNYPSLDVNFLLAHRSILVFWFSL